MSASRGEWRGAKRVEIYSCEGFDFGSGGSQFARRQLVVARREQLDTRREMVDARLELVGASC
jgi:hypothetical protein